MQSRPGLEDGAGEGCGGGGRLPESAGLARDGPSDGTSSGDGPNGSATTGQRWPAMVWVSDRWPPAYVLGTSEAVEREHDLRRYGSGLLAKAKPPNVNALS